MERKKTAEPSSEDDAYTRRRDTCPAMRRAVTRSGVTECPCSWGLHSPWSPLSAGRELQWKPSIINCAAHTSVGFGFEVAVLCIKDKIGFVHIGFGFQRIIFFSVANAVCPLCFCCIETSPQQALYLQDPMQCDRNRAFLSSLPPHRATLPIPQQILAHYYFSDNADCSFKCFGSCLTPKPNLDTFISQDSLRIVSVEFVLV